MALSFGLGGDPPPDGQISVSYLLSAHSGIQVFWRECRMKNGNG
jgi:hypothetical protein